ncbi:GM14725 [Drosophila sechellia]|uniref:GM14725 n=1 Tax=Drosophila sechellia TaxID=7238 RepID=B4HUJ9_DROSE|nr:GM14725 [Drosophila sechellia]
MRNHPSGSVRIQDVLTTPVMQNFQPVRLKDGNDHTLAILSSSGTSGFPKAVTISNSHKIIVDYMGIQIKILDEQGEAQGPNVVGEICFNNGQKWLGYYQNPDETRKIQDSENWIHTGDLGYVDEDGYLFVIDRLKDMLK